jgi:hypothetical protein
MTAPSVAVTSFMDRIVHVRQEISAGTLSVEDVAVVYVELTELYLAALRGLERGQTQLRVSKERI